jgi:hypothetical protein
MSRALIQVRMEDDGSQECQARYFVRKIHAPAVDIELPLPLSRFRKLPEFMLGGRPLTHWKKLDATERVLRLQLHPEKANLPAVLEITYTIPADALERSSAWATNLHAPVFHSEVMIGQTRWQLTTPTPTIAAAFGRNMQADTRWGLQGWLWTPEPASNGADGEAWLLGKEPAGGGASVTFAFSASAAPATIYHWPRHWWLLCCSGVFLVVTLGAFFSPLPRRAYLLLLATLALGLAAFTVAFPAAWAGIVFGLQPGVLLLIVFIVAHWLLQERYRRQLVFLPGRARAKAGSTIVRSAGAKRPREASTVDAPPAGAEAPSVKSVAPPSGT